MKSKMSLYLDDDLCVALKQKAASKGERYQAMVNRILREVILNEMTVDKRLEVIEKKIAKIETKVS